MPTKEEVSLAGEILKVLFENSTIYRIKHPDPEEEQKARDLDRAHMRGYQTAVDTVVDVLRSRGFTVVAEDEPCETNE